MKATYVSCLREYTWLLLFIYFVMIVIGKHVINIFRQLGGDDYGGKYSPADGKSGFVESQVCKVTFNFRFSKKFSTLCFQLNWPVSSVFKDIAVGTGDL